MVSPYLSQKIKLLSLFCIILVLYIHSDFHDYPHEILGMPFNHYLQDAISDKVGRGAVPLFFMISGFLFFHNVTCLQDIWRKMRSRVKTLLVPFIIGAVFFPLFMIVAQSFPFSAKYFNSGTSFLDTILQQPISDTVCCLFYKANGNLPWALHLWFLRDLIITVILSPILFFLIRNKAALYIGGGILLTINTLNPETLSFIPSISIFWFSLGAVCLGKLNKIGGICWPVAYLIVAALELTFPSWEAWRYLAIPLRFACVMSIWSAYDALVAKEFDIAKHKLMGTLCSFTFFIYLFHWPTLNVVRKLLIVVLGNTSPGFAINYLISPWVLVALLVTIGILLKKFCPRTYGVCVGGR